MKFQTSLAAIIVCSSAVAFAADNARQPNGTPEAARGGESPNAQSAERPVGGQQSDAYAEGQEGKHKPGQTNANATLAHKDRKFIEGAAKDGLAEVELARIAQTKASSDEVKNFAVRLEQDHSKANDELKQIAQQKGINVPYAADHKQMREMKKLEKTSGADFDRRYMAEMVRDHEKDLKKFNDEAKNAKDSEVKAFAEKTAQVIEQHLEMARKIAVDVGAMSDKSSALSTK
jgi:putative membrane protein